jgi:serine/threonine protein kinase
LQIAAQLDHRNIVRAYDAERAGDLQLLAMEFVEGQSLAELVTKKGPLPIAYACNYVLQAALGLQHAHERNMVHRDIKPQNLMLTTKGVVKILDFGLARLRSERRTSNELTRDNAMMGTPEYIAPEQAQDSKKADIRADIYSLGCTLFFLLTGRPPFRGSDWLAVVMAHLKDAPPPLENWRADVPPELADLVTRMLAKDPAARLQTPKEVAEALLPFTKSARGSQTTAPRAVIRTNGATLARPGDSEDTVDEPARESSKRLRWLIPTAAAAAVLLGFGAWGIVHSLKTTDGTVAVAVNEPTVDRKPNLADGTPKPADPPRLQTPAGPKAAEPMPADPSPAPKPAEPTVEESKPVSPVPPGAPPVAKDGEKPMPVMPVVPVQPVPPPQPAPNPVVPLPVPVLILPLLPPPPPFTNAQRSLAPGIELLRVVDEALYKLNISPQDPEGPQKDAWRQEARKELAEAYHDILAGKRGKDVKENLTKAKGLIHQLEQVSAPATGKAPPAQKGKGKGKASQDKNRSPLGPLETALDVAITAFKQARIID